MKRTILLVVVAILAANSLAVAGDLDHLYTPYGYSLPWLSQGEYILTGRYAEERGSTVAHYDEGDSAWSDDDPDRQFRLAGILAVTDYLLLSGQLDYNLGGTARHYTANDYFAQYDQDPLLVPSMTAVFRPWQRLQISANYSRHSQKVSSRSEYDFMGAPQITSSSEKRTFEAYSFKVVWSGKL